MTESEITFSSFVSSLAAGALIAMGITPGLSEQAASPDLRLARELIDTIEMLERKTAGNLDSTETDLVRHILTELRLHYVNQSEQAQQASSQEK